MYVIAGIRVVVLDIKKDTERFVEQVQVLKTANNFCTKIIKIKDTFFEIVKWRITTRIKQGIVKRPIFGS